MSVDDRRRARSAHRDRRRAAALSPLAAGGPAADRRAAGHRPADARALGGQRSRCLRGQPRGKRSARGTARRRNCVRRRGRRRAGRHGRPDRRARDRPGALDQHLRLSPGTALRLRRRRAARNCAWRWIRSCRSSATIVRRGRRRRSDGDLAQRRPAGDPGQQSEAARCARPRSTCSARTTRSRPRSPCRPSPTGSSTATSISIGGGRSAADQHRLSDRGRCGCR